MEGWVNVYIDPEGRTFLGCVVWPSRERAAKMSGQSVARTVYRLRIRLK